MTVDTHQSSSGDSNCLEAKGEGQYPLGSANSPVEEDRHQDSSNTRKRKRSPRRSVPNELESAKRIAISNNFEVSKFLQQYLGKLPQYICRLVAKAWIKTIHPKKQSMYPYAKGYGKPPSWWPPTTPVGVLGPLRGKVRHREPDHLQKDGWNPFLLDRLGTVPN